MADVEGDDAPEPEGLDEDIVGAVRFSYIWMWVIESKGQWTLHHNLITLAWVANTRANIKSQHDLLNNTSKSLREERTHPRESGVHNMNEAGWYESIEE